MSVELVTVKVEPLDFSEFPDDDSAIPQEGADKGDSISLGSGLPAHEGGLKDSLPNENGKNPRLSHVTPDSGIVSENGDSFLKEVSDAPNLSEVVAEPEFVSIKAELEDDEPYHSPAPSSPELFLDDLATTTPPLEGPKSSRKKKKSIKEDLFNVTIKQEPLEEDECTIPVDPSYLMKTDDNSSSDGEESDIDTSKYIRNEDVKKIMSQVTDNFECAVCKMNLSTKSNLQRHIMRHVKHKILCKLCKRQFLTKQMLKQHIKYTHEEKIFKCDECPVTFEFSADLLKHKKEHEKYKCDQCGKTYSDLRLYKRHVGRKQCKKKVDLPCDQCGKIFRRESMLHTHQRAHTVDRPHECTHCNMKFKDKSTLTRHLQLHIGLKPYACKICGKRFTSAGLIKPHMRTHTGDRPFICTICDKAFSHKYNMIRHFESHEKKKHKKLVCEICLKVFPRESRLMYHMRIHMEDKKPFKCELCVKSFSNRQNIVRHYARKHPTAQYTKADTDASVARELWRAAQQQRTAAQLILPHGANGADSQTDLSSKKFTPKVLNHEDFILRIKTN